MSRDTTQVLEHNVPAHLLLRFCRFGSFAKDAVEVRFSAGGQVLSWMEGRGKKEKEENEDLIISQLVLSCAGKHSSVQSVTLGSTVSHFPAPNDVTEDTDTGFSDNTPPARWSLAL